MADRIVVLFEGRVSREFARAEATRTRSCAPPPGWSRKRRDDALAEARPHGRSPRRAARTRSRSCLPLPRARHRARARARGRRRPRSTTSNFLSATSLQQLLSGAAIIAPARDRRDDGDRHAQRRPLGRLGARHLRLRRRRALRRPPARPARRSFLLAGLGIGARLRGRQRRDRDGRARAEPRRHARNALRHPRHRRRLGRRQPGRRVRCCPTASTRSATARSLGVPYLGDHRDRRGRDRGVLRCAASARRATSTRSARIRRRRGSRASPSARASSSPSSSAAASPGVAGALWLSLATARSTRSPAPATSSR